LFGDRSPEMEIEASSSPRIFILGVKWISMMLVSKATCGLRDLGFRVQGFGFRVWG
jgi:hypothetical protein